MQLTTSTSEMYILCQGCIPLVSLRSRQCVGDLKMAGTVRAAAFTADGGHLLTSGASLTEAAAWCKHLRRCKQCSSGTFQHSQTA